MEDYNIFMNVALEEARKSKKEGGGDMEHYLLKMERFFPEDMILLIKQEIHYAMQR